MSESKERKTVKAATVKSFAHRNIKKDYTEAREYETLTKQFHLELGEKGEAVKVEDRKRDWLELANKDADKCGLAYVLDLARRRGEDISQFAYKDSEAMDTSMIDPLDPESTKKAAMSVNSNAAKLEATAKQLGLTVDELIDSFVKGELASVISSKLEEKVKETSSESEAK